MQFRTSRRPFSDLETYIGVLEYAKVFANFSEDLSVYGK